MEVLNLSMCQGITENALVPLCNSLHRYYSSSKNYVYMYVYILAY